MGLAHRAVGQPAHVILVANVFGILRFVSEMGIKFSHQKLQLKVRLQRACIFLD